MVDLTIRKERIVEKKVRLNPKYSKGADRDPDNNNQPKLLYEVIISDHTFSNDLIQGTIASDGYRVSIAIDQSLWERLVVGMTIDIIWSVPDV